MGTPDRSYTPTVWERVVAMLEPSALLSSAMYHYVIVCLEAVFKRGDVLAPVLRVGRLRDEAFGRFWLKFSAQPQRDPTNTNTKDTNTPSAPVQGSAALIPPLLATASGIVLDIGPGSGTQMPLLAASSAPGIRTIYGAEPCVGLHDELRQRARAEGLEDKYVILPCSVERKALVPELEKRGVLVPEDGSGVFDTILCVRVLCSVPDPERTVADLYDLLRPGGKMLVVEHVVNPWRTRKGSFVARVVQSIYGLLGWSFFLGDCHMDRDTAGLLRKVAEEKEDDGGWEVEELEEWFGWSPLPYVAGRLVKKGGKKEIESMSTSISP